MGRPKQLNPCCEVIVDPPDPPITDCEKAICIAFIDENFNNKETIAERITKIQGFATAFPDRLLFVLDVYRGDSLEVLFPAEFYNQTNLFHLKVHGPIAGLGTGEGNSELTRCKGDTAKGDINNPWGKITSLVSYFEANGRAGVQAKFNAAQEVSIFIDDSGSMNIHDIGQNRSGTGFTYAGTIKKLRDDIEATGRTIVSSLSNRNEDPICPFVTNNCCTENINSLHEACKAGSPCNPASISFVKQPNNGLTREYCDNTYGEGSEFYGVCPQCISESEEEDQQTVEYTARISNSTGTSLDHELVSYILEYSDDSGESWDSLRILPDGYSNVEQSLNVADKSVDDCPQILREGSVYGNAVNDFLDSRYHWCSNHPNRNPYKKNQNFIPIVIDGEEDEEFIDPKDPTLGERATYRFCKTAVSETYRLVNGVKEWEVFAVQVIWYYRTTGNNFQVDRVCVPYAKTRKFTVREDSTWSLVYESELLIHGEIFQITTDPSNPVARFACINLNTNVSIDCGPLSKTSDSTYWAVGYSLFAYGSKTAERVEWFGPTFDTDGRPTTGRISTLEDDEYIIPEKPHGFGGNVSVPKFSLDNNHAPPYIVVSAQNKGEGTGRVFVYTMGLGGHASGRTVLQPIENSREEVQPLSLGFLNNTNPRSNPIFGWSISQVRRLSRDFSKPLYHNSAFEDEQQNLHVIAIGAPNVEPNNRNVGAVYISHIYFNTVSGTWQFAPSQALGPQDALASTVARYKSLGYSVELIDDPHPLLVVGDPKFTLPYSASSRGIAEQGAFAIFEIVNDANRYWKCSNAKTFLPPTVGVEDPTFPLNYGMGTDISITKSNNGGVLIHLSSSAQSSSSPLNHFITVRHIGGDYWSEPDIRFVTRLQEYVNKYYQTSDPNITGIGRRTCLDFYLSAFTSTYNLDAPSVDRDGSIYILPFFVGVPNEGFGATNANDNVPTITKESGFITLLGNSSADYAPACNEFNYNNMGTRCGNRVFRRLFRIRAKSESNPSLSVLSREFQLYEIVRTGADGYSGGVG